MTSEPLIIIYKIYIIKLTLVYIFLKGKKMNLNKNIDVLGVGNAIVDIVASVDEQFISKHKLIKGSMVLAEQVESEKILNSINPILKTSGGSAANTIYGLSQLGCKGAFIGKTSQDDIGEFFKKNLISSGIIFDTSYMDTDVPSGRCLILVTSDAERTMVTFLGSSKDLSEKDIDENIISRSRIVYLEGYLFDPLEAQKAFKTASNFAHKHDSLVAFTLSDSFCVERHREKMRDFISKDVNILLCNEAEIFSLYKNNSLKYCINNLRNEVDIAAITMGKKGAIIIDKTNTHEIIALPAKVIDTTGAGDFFAAGFLAGLSKNFDLERAGKLGAACSAEIITHFGARPEIPLNRYVKKFDISI